jgi:hypothetical protein
MFNADSKIGIFSDSANHALVVAVVRLDDAVLTVEFS